MAKKFKGKEGLAIFWVTALAACVLVAYLLQTGALPITITS